MTMDNGGVCVNRTMKGNLMSQGRLDGDTMDSGFSSSIMIQILG